MSNDGNLMADSQEPSEKDCSRFERPEKAGEEHYQHALMACQISKSERSSHAVGRIAAARLDATPTSTYRS